jgi:hypothetical protein
MHVLLAECVVINYAYEFDSDQNNQESGGNGSY